MTRLSTIGRFNWTEVRNLTAIIRKGRRALTVSVFNVPEGKWNAVALETTMGAARAGIEAVLDDHSHQVLGEDLSLEQAKRACREFAKRWTATKHRSKRCACEDISGGRSKIRETRLESQ